MLIAIYPLALAIVGALVYALSSNANAKALGLGTFYAGMFAFAFATAGHTVRLM
jgi:hypothetical protein